MSKIVFLNVPAHGHTNPTLDLVRELVNRGHEVVYFSFPDMRDKIIATGSAYRSYTHCPELIDNDSLMKSIFYFYYFIFYFTYHLLDDLIVDVTDLKPDLIIYDGLCYWGKCVADITQIPSITSISTCFFPFRAIGLWHTFWQMLSFRPRDVVYVFRALVLQNTIQKGFYLRRQHAMQYFFNTSACNILYTSREFQPFSFLYDEKKFHYIGPAYRAPSDEYKDLPKPLIYIALGTIRNDKISFYRNCVTALRDWKGTVVMSVGQKIRVETFSDIPSNWIIKNHVDQLALLNHVDVFISHSGMNSVQEALYHGIPLVLFPQFLEQEVICQRVVERGCGIRLPSIQPKIIRKAVDHVLSETSYRVHCKLLSISLQHAGGFMRGADLVEERMRIK